MDRKSRMNNARVTRPAAPHDPATASNATRKTVIIAMLLTAPYWMTVRHDYTLDDTRVIEVNRFVQGGIGKTPQILAGEHWYAQRGYRPLPTISFALEKTLFDSNATAAHLINVVLYGLTVFFLFLLFRRLFPKESRTTLWIAVGLFALHPVHTEVVSSVKSRDEILCLLFFLSSLLLLFRDTKNGILGLRTYLPSAMLFLFAAMSKETALVFPVLYIAVFFFVRRKGIARSILLSLPFLIAGLFYYLFLKFVIDISAGTSEESVLNNALAAAPSVWSRLGTAVFITGKYLRLLVFPYPLIHDYSYDQIPLVTSLTHPGFWIALAAVAALLLCGIITARRRPGMSIAVWFLFVPLLPVSNIFFLIGSTMGERFLYTPSLALSLAFLSLPNRTKARLSRPPILYLVGIAGLIVASYTSIRARQWRDNLTLYSHDLRHGARNASMHASLGNRQIFLAQQRQYAKSSRDSLYREAVENLRKSLEIYEPNFYAHGNLGQAYSYLGVHDSAVAHLRRAEELEQNDQTTFLALADAMFESGMYDSAYARYEKAYQADPSNPFYVLRMADIKALTGRPQVARDYYHRILDAYPGYVPARKRIAVLDSVGSAQTDTTQ